MAWLEAWRQIFVDAVQNSGLPSDNLDNNLNEWFYIHIDNINHSVILEIRHKDVDPAVSKDVFLDLNEAKLQVTFEYEEQ